MNSFFSKRLSLRSVMMMLLAASFAIFKGCSKDGDEVIPETPPTPTPPKDNTQVVIDFSTLALPNGEDVEFDFRIIPSSVDISTSGGFNVKLCDAEPKDEISYV